LLVAARSAAEPAARERTLPPVDPELLTGPQSADRQARQAQQECEARREIARLKAEVESAKTAGLPTDQMEAEIERLDQSIAALYRPPTWDPIHLFWPVLRARTAEIRGITSGDKPLALEDARRLVDMLYTNIEPRLNNNLQHATLLGIQQASEKNLLSGETRRFLRDSVLDYFNATRDGCDAFNRGPMCSPLTMLFLAQSIAAVATSDDAEAMAAFQHLKTAGAIKCDALQWEREKALFLGSLAIAEEGMSLKDEEVGGISELGSVELGGEDITRLLRTYRKVLRGPPARVKPEVAATIDRNLLRLAAGELSRRNWELWADAAIALGPQRASTAMKEHVARQGKGGDSPQARELVRVGKWYSKFRPGRGKREGGADGRRREVRQ
jgi:hypothetical protein